MKDYSDIINSQRPISSNHKPMSIHDRAAQFMPFAALKGYEEAIFEKEKEYCQKKQISDEQIEKNNSILLQLSFHKDWIFQICYFKKEKAEKGNYYIKKGYCKKIDSLEKYIELEDGTTIPFEDIYEIRCDAYQSIKEE